jgi:hypothetical protein
LDRRRAHVVEVFDGGGALRVAELLERAPAAFSEDDLEALALRSDLDGLLQAVGLDGGREGVDVVGGVPIHGTGVDLGDGDRDLRQRRRSLGFRARVDLDLFCLAAVGIGSLREV